MTKQISISEQIFEYVEDFARQMEQSTEIRDGMLTARVVGEFSAGKTRLLRELLSDVTPTALFPVSSIERQTRLQLEITYGEQAELTLIRRGQDYDDAEMIRRLEQFPQRHEIAEKYDPLQYRLRLAIPEPRLILPEGDGYQEEKVPMRLFLIDTPGWNSGDDELAEAPAQQIMTGHHNLALVYVTDARRLDGATNQTRLRDFLTVLRGADFLQEAHLLMVITHCPPEDQARLQQRASERVMSLWAEIGEQADSLKPVIECVEFEGMDDRQLQEFRTRFWAQLLAPLGETPAEPVNPWVRQIQSWPLEWDVRPHIRETWRRLEVAKQLLAKVRVEGNYIKGMNHHRLLGLDDAAARKRLLEVWLRQLGYAGLDAVRQDLGHRLEWPGDHPLSAWWKGYWQPLVNQVQNSVEAFIKGFEAALAGYHVCMEDLQAHFSIRLDHLREDWDDISDTSFTRLVQTLLDVAEEPAAEERVATMLTLSLLEGRYREHYEAAKVGISPSGRLIKKVDHA